MELLKGVYDRHVMAAAMHIVSTRSDWPPDVALLRCTALSIADGDLAGASGAESWATILSLIGGGTVALTGRERAAMKATGSLYDLKRSGNQAADRARYIDAYDSLADRAKKTREMLPSVGDLNAENVDVPEIAACGQAQTEEPPPALPSPVNDDNEHLTAEQIAELTAEYHKLGKSKFV